MYAIILENENRGNENKEHILHFPLMLYIIVCGSLKINKSKGLRASLLLLFIIYFRDSSGVG